MEMAINCCVASGPIPSLPSLALTYVQSVRTL